MVMPTAMPSLHPSQRLDVISLAKNSMANSGQRGWWRLMCARMSSAVNFAIGTVSEKVIPDLARCA